MRLVLSLAVVLATPLVAQENADAAIDMLVERCDTIADDPQGMIDAAFDDTMSEAARTPDGAMTEYSGGVDTANGIPVSYFASRLDLDGGLVVSCTVTAFVSDGTPPYPDIEQVLDTRAEAMLGAPVTPFGGPVLQSGQAALLRQWTTGTFPPTDTIKLLSADGFVSVSILRTIPSAPPQTD